MYSVSDLFKHYLSQSDRQFEIKTVIDGKTYDNTSVIEFSIEDSIVPSEEFTLGSVISAKLTLSIRTSDTIANNAQVQPYVRMYGNDGYTEWLPLGVFYIDSRTYQNNVWKFTCFDKLITSQQDYVSGLAFPVSMQEVWDEICNALDDYIPLSGVSWEWPFDFTVAGDVLTQPCFYIDSGVKIDPTYNIPYKPDGLYTMRDMMGYIASAHASSVKMTREGQLKFVKFAPETEITPIGPSEFFRCDQTNPLKGYTRVVLTYNADGETLEVGTGDDDHTLNFYNPFMDQVMLNDVYDVISGQSLQPLSTNWPFDQTVLDDPASTYSELSYIPFSMSWKGRPDLDVGDFISVTQRDGSIIRSMLLSNKLDFKGGLKEESAAQSTSAQKSEFTYKGTLQSRFNDLRTKSLQLDQPYYGVTIGRAYGIKVEKSDGSSKAIFNSDAIEILKGGTEKVFYTDVNGDLQIAGFIKAKGLVISDGSSLLTPDGTKIAGTKIDSNGLTLGTGASIDWTKVNAPNAAQVGARPDTWMPTAADVGALATNWVGTTHIDSNGLYTGTINANQINVGYLTGFTVRTSSGSSRIEMNGTDLTSYYSGYTSIKLTTSTLEFWGSGSYLGYHSGKIFGNGHAMGLDADTGFIFTQAGSYLLNMGLGTTFLYSNLVLTGANADMTCYNLKAVAVKSSIGDNIIRLDNGCYIESLSDGIRLHFNASNYFYIGTSGAYAVVNGTWTRLA